MANRNRPTGRGPEWPVRQRSAASQPARQRSAAPKPAQLRQTRRNTAPRRKKQATGLWMRLLTMLIIVTVFILGVAIFFKVTDIQVQGNVLYTAEEVAIASGVEKGDNLITMNKASVAGHISAVLPYVEKVRIGRVLPGTVVIEVVESDAVYAVQADNGTSWLMNGNGKILEQATVSAADYPRLTGVTAIAPEVGVQIDCEQTESLTAAKTVLDELEKTDYISKIMEINVTKPYSISIWYGTQYEVLLGGTDQMEYKIQYLTALLSQLDGTQGGQLDLTLQEENVAVFKSWQNEEPINEDNVEIDENSSDIS